jgi:hypothetical protein
MASVVAGRPPPVRTRTLPGLTDASRAPSADQASATDLPGPTAPDDAACVDVDEPNDTAAIGERNLHLVPPSPGRRDPGDIAGKETVAGPVPDHDAKARAGLVRDART